MFYFGKDRTRVVSFRSAGIGPLSAFTISAFTCFSSHAIGQTFPVGTHLPVAVFGLLPVLPVTINPRIEHSRRGGRRPGFFGLITGKAPESYRVFSL